MLTVALNLDEHGQLLKEIAQIENRTTTQQIEYFLKKAISSYRRQHPEAEFQPSQNGQQLEGRSR